jgi:hypothetical protein
MSCAVFLNERICLKTNHHLSLNDKDFPEESILFDRTTQGEMYRTTQGEMYRRPQKCHNVVMIYAQAVPDTLG